MVLDPSRPSLKGILGKQKGNRLMSGALPPLPRAQAAARKNGRQGQPKVVVVVVVVVEGVYGNGGGGGGGGVTSSSTRSLSFSHSLLTPPSMPPGSPPPPSNLSSALRSPPTTPSLPPLRRLAVLHGPHRLGELDLTFHSSYSARLYLPGHIGDRIDLRRFLSFGMLSIGVSTAAFGMGCCLDVPSLGFFVADSGGRLR